MGFTTFNVPELDSIVARCRCEDIFCRGIEEDLSNLSTSCQASSPNLRRAYLECPVNFSTGATSTGSSASEYKLKPCGTCQMKTFPSSDPEAITLSLKGFLPSSAVASSKRHLNPPICVQNRRSMSSKQWDLLRQSTLLIHRYNSKGASATGFPIDSQVFRVCLRKSQSAPPASNIGHASSHLHQICIPSISTDMQVIIARLLPRGLPKDVSCDCVSLPSCFWLGGKLKLTIFRRAHESSCHLDSGLWYSMVRRFYR